MKRAPKFKINGVLFTFKDIHGDRQTARTEPVGDGFAISVDRETGKTKTATWHTNGTVTEVIE